MCTGLQIDASVTASAARNGLPGSFCGLSAGASALQAAVGAPNQPAGQAAPRTWGRTWGDRWMDPLWDARSEVSHSDAEGSASSTEGRPIGVRSERVVEQTTATPPAKRPRTQRVPFNAEMDHRLKQLVIRASISSDRPQDLPWSQIAIEFTMSLSIPKDAKQCRERCVTPCVVPPCPRPPNPSPPLNRLPRCHRTPRNTETEAVAPSPFCLYSLTSTPWHRGRARAGGTTT